MQTNNHSHTMHNHHDGESLIEQLEAELALLKESDEWDESDLHCYFCHREVSREGALLLLADAGHLRGVIIGYTCRACEDEQDVTRLHYPHACSERTNA